jgi:hypothetical protein
MTTPSTTKNSVLRAGIVVLTLGTAAIHLQLNFPDPVFILNGPGYLALLAELYAPLPQLTRCGNVVRWVLIGYAAITILLWVLIGARNGLAYADKAIEVALITLLLIEARGRRSSP